MLSCPHGGVCANCKYVRSMAVGDNQRDRVYACSKFNLMPLTMLGYDGRYGNRPVPVEPLAGNCYETCQSNTLNGGWYSGR